MSKYLVVNENTLCYSQEGTVMLGVLTGSVLRGGRDWKMEQYLLLQAIKFVQQQKKILNLIGSAYHQTLNSQKQ
jgi:hypothetical protein